jgi:hypothetical protein
LAGCSAVSPEASLLECAHSLGSASFSFAPTPSRRCVGVSLSNKLKTVWRDAVSIVTRLATQRQFGQPLACNSTPGGTQRAASGLTAASILRIGQPPANKYEDRSKCLPLVSKLAQYQSSHRRSFTMSNRAAHRSYCSLRSCQGRQRRRVWSYTLAATGDTLASAYCASRTY